MTAIERLDTESKWFVSVGFESELEPLEYKYVVKHKDTLEILSWEAIPGNRTLTITKGVNVAL